MNSFLIALIAGLSGMLGWGISDFFAKKTIDKIGALKTLIGMQIIGGLTLLMFFLLNKQAFPTITGTMLFYVSALALLDGAGYLFLYRAFEKGVMSIVSPIAASAAGFSVIVAVFVFKESLSLFGSLGVILIFLGILITSTDLKDLRSSFSKANLTNGIPEAIAVMFLVGLWFPLWDKFVEGQEWLFWLIALKLTTGTMLCIYFYLTNKEKKLMNGYKSVIRTLVPVAVLDTIAYLGTTWGYSITTNTTSLITVVANAYSLPTIILAYFLLKERINKQQALGIASIIGGIVISSL
jgi:drug/metabolite transporter (DMT)-like permease